MQPTFECRECGHSVHGPTCLVIWMGEQCECTVDATADDEERETPTTDDVLIEFRCENCQQTVSAPMADDWTVECPACTHTVHAGVYVADSELRALWRLDPESE